jgi:hypothetical protein
MDLSGYPAFLNVAELAELLRINEETVKRRARAGQFPRVPGLRCYRFPRDELFHVLTHSRRKTDDE